MARTIRLYNLFRALCTAHLHRPFFVFIFLQRGLSLSEILLLQVIFSIAVIALEVPTGLWADRLGRRHSMGMGALIMGAASVGYFFAPTLWTIAACEFAFAAGLTLTSGADSAYLYDQLKSYGRAGEYLQRESMASAAKHVGLALAAFGGGLIALSGRLEYTFLVTAAVCFAAFFVARRFPESGSHQGEFGESREHLPRAEVHRAWLRGMREGLEVIKNKPVIVWAILYSAMVFVLIRVSDTLLQPVLKGQGFSFLGLGLAFAGLNFVAATAALRVGNLNWKRWGSSLVWSLPILMAISYIFVSLFGAIMAVVLLVAHFAVTGIYSPVVKNMINRELGASRLRATVLSAESATRRLVVLLVIPLLSLVFVATGGAPKGDVPTVAAMRPALFLCGGIAVLGTFALFLYRRQRTARPSAPRPRPEPAPPELAAAPRSPALPSTK